MSAALREARRDLLPYALTVIVGRLGHRDGVQRREYGIDAARISSVVRQGGIYHEILEEAAAIKADLIVMTSHRPAMRTYFLGSNAGHVVRYAKCSVLVVRH